MGHCSTSLVFPENRTAQNSGSHDMDRTQVDEEKFLSTFVFFVKDQIHRQFFRKYRKNIILI